MGTFITILIMIASALLVLLVLMQNSEGGGLTSDFGAAQQIGGVKQTNAFVEKATWSLAGFIAVMSVVLTLMFHTPTVIPQQNQTTTTEQPAQQPVPAQSNQQTPSSQSDQKTSVK